MASLKKKSKFKFGGIGALCFAAAISGAVSGCSKAPGASDYLVSKGRVIADYKTQITKCDQLSDNAKDVCSQRAEGDQSVALAELDFKQSGQDEDRAKVALAKSDAKIGRAHV